MNGKCGICGDSYDLLKREHEAPGGKYANGIIVRDYYSGESIKVVVDVTANHYGYFTFKLCPNNNILQDPTQECFDRYRFYFKNFLAGFIFTKYQNIVLVNRYSCEIFQLSIVGVWRGEICLTR